MDRQNTNERAKRTNEQIRTLVSSQRMRREFLWHFCAALRAFAGYRGRVLAWNFHKATRNADSSLDCYLKPTALFCWHISSTLFSRPVSSPFCYLFSLALLCQLTLSVFSGTFLLSFTSGLARDLAFRPFVWVSCKNWQRGSLTDTHTNRNECYPSCHTLKIR